MMRILKNFKCEESGVIFDRLVVSDIVSVECKCGVNAGRVMSAPRFLGNSTGGNASFKQKRG
jgi:hypothetical protein